jgi:hypothetical protein
MNMHRRFADCEAGNVKRMLRKGLWTVLYGALGAVATIAARTAASRVWRIATGEQPPVKK